VALISAGAPNNNLAVPQDKEHQPEKVFTTKKYPCHRRPKFHAHKRCGACVHRTGKACHALGIGRGGRCRLHGGLGTRPKTSDGKARQAEAIRA